MKNLRLGYVDGLRGLAALGVVLEHLYFLAYSGHIHPSAVQAFAHLFLYGHYGVSAFIVISGFSLMLPCADGFRLKNGFGHYIARRARRLIPPFYVSLLACLLLGAYVLQPMGTAFDGLGKASLIGVVVHLLLMQAFTHTIWSSINGVFWSLSVEWWIYFLMPLLLLGWRRLGPVPTVMITCILGGGLYPSVERAGFDRANPQFIGLFALGMLAATVGYSDAWKTVCQRIPWGILLAVSGLGGVAFFARVPFEALPEWPTDFIVGLVVSLVLVDCARRRYSPLLSCSPLVTVGRFSYSLYLMHIPFLMLFFQFIVAPRYVYLQNDGTWLLLAGVGVPVVIACSYLWFLIAERPFFNRPTKVMESMPDKSY